MEDAELLEIIARAKNEGATDLNLSNRGIKRLPSEIGQLTNLIVLFLHNNQLSSLPPELGQLTNLHFLSLNNNELSSLPPELGQLTNLEALSVHGNPLPEALMEARERGIPDLLEYLRSL